MLVNTRVVIGMAAVAIAAWAALTATALIWMAATDPLWMVTMVARVLTGLW